MGNLNQQNTRVLILNMKKFKGKESAGVSKGLAEKSQNEAYKRKTRQQHQKLLCNCKILQHSLITQKIVQSFNKKFCLRGALNARGGEFEGTDLKKFKWPGVAQRDVEALN